MGSSYSLLNKSTADASLEKSSLSLGDLGSRTHNVYSLNDLLLVSPKSPTILMSPKISMKAKFELLSKKS